MRLSSVTHIERTCSDGPICRPHAHTQCSPSTWGCWKVNLHNHIRGEEGGVKAKGPGDGHRLLWRLRESGISQGCVTAEPLSSAARHLWPQGPFYIFGGTGLKIMAFASLRWAGRRQFRTGDPASIRKKQERADERVFTVCRRTVDYLPSVFRSSPCTLQPDPFKWTF